MVLKQAFNGLTRIHSVAATLKRMGTPILFSPIRVTPSNYFRFLAGPSNTSIHGREFIIPVDTILGSSTGNYNFDTLPASGSFMIVYDGAASSDIQFDATADQIQVIVRQVAGLETALVSGNFASGITITGAPDATLLDYASGAPPLTDSDDEEVEISIAIGTDPLDPPIKRTDKIVHPTYGSLAIDEIVEIPDIGGTVMGYRVRCE